MACSVIVLSRSDDLSGLHNLQGVDREDGIRRGFDFHGATVTGQVNRATDGLSVNAESDHRTAAEEGVPRAHVFAPVIVIEFLIVRDMDVGAIDTDRHIACHLVRATDERQFISAVEVTVVLDVSVHGVGKVFDGIHAPGSDERCGFAIRVRDVR